MTPEQAAQAAQREADDATRYHEEAAADPRAPRAYVEQCRAAAISARMRARTARHAADMAVRSGPPVPAAR